MTSEEIKANIEAKDAEQTVLLIEVSDGQKAVLDALGISVKEANTLAETFFTNGIKGKLQASIDRAIKAKYLADSKGKVALSAEYEKEIKHGLSLKSDL